MTTRDPADAPARRLRRADRREDILAAASRAFARAGYAATSLDDIATEAGISRVILYRHFDSKADLYRAVLNRACTHLADTVGRDNYNGDSIRILVTAASADPDGFRLLFRHAAREPEFRDITDQLRSSSADVALRHLADQIPDPAWADWAAQLVPTVTTEAVIAWLNAGQPDPHHAPQRIEHAVHAVIRAAQLPTGTGI